MESFLDLSKFITVHMGQHRVSWKTLDDKILAVIEDLKRIGFTEPTIRSVYYVLGSQGVIPMTKNYYKSLDAKLVEMRRANQIPFGFFAVKRGRAINASMFNSPDEWAEMWLNSVRNAHHRYRVPRWYGQHNQVEVWVEKDGLLGVTSNWIRDLDVTVRAPQGYAPWEFVYASLKEILERATEFGHSEVHIFYLGDLDPSGTHIPYFMKNEAIAYFEDEWDVEVCFHDLGLTPEQVDEHGLPCDPDPETAAKIKRDSRRQWYLERFPDKYTELDALYALAPDAARSLVRQAVEGMFDKTEHDESRVVEREGKAEVRKIIQSTIEWK